MRGTAYRETTVLAELLRNGDREHQGPRRRLDPHRELQGRRLPLGRLFLALSDGNAEMIDLHNRLYTGLLAPFLRSDIEYIPHVGLGHIGIPDAAYDPMEPQEVPLDRPRYARALQEAQRLGLDYRCEVASIGVVSLDTQLRGITRDEVGLGQAD